MRAPLKPCVNKNEIKNVAALIFPLRAAKGRNYIWAKAVPDPVCFQCPGAIRKVVYPILQKGNRALRRK